jgi:hypothetical protein
MKNNNCLSTSKSLLACLKSEKIYYDIVSLRNDVTLSKPKLKDFSSLLFGILTLL